MMWTLPKKAEFDGHVYGLNTDYRDILEIIGYLNDDMPEFLRWQVALALFYKEPVADADQGAAIDFLALFIAGGETVEDTAGARLMDWQQDAAAIISDINKVAGREIREMPYLHWWTFLSWFHSIGDGQLSALVQIRDKRRRGQKLTEAEQEFCRANRKRVELAKHYTREEIDQQERLKKLLDG